MFTGIVEAVGRVRAMVGGRESSRIDVEAGDVSAGVKLGDSVAVNGACLTVTALDGQLVSFDAVRETLERTNLGELVAGSRVNLERAMRADARFDGHIVQGHVDGVGVVEGFERSGDDVRLEVECPEELAALLVDKGSVTVDGVSLTVVCAGSSGFDVVLIPHTLRETNLCDAGPGRKVNLEADVLGKYVRRYLEQMGVADRLAAH